MRRWIAPSSAPLAAPAALHDGRRQNIQSPLWLCADEDHLHRAPSPRQIGSSKWLECYCHPRSAEHSPTMRSCAWPRPRQPQLHVVQRSHRLLRESVRCRRGHHFKSLRRTLPQTRNSRPHDVSGRRAAIPARLRKTPASRCVARSRCTASRRFSRKAIGGRHRQAQFRSTRHRDFLQRQHRRSKGRDAHALQHRVRTFSRYRKCSCSTDETRFSASCPSSTPSASWPRCGCRRSNGVGVVYHPNPLDAQVIGELVEKYVSLFSSPRRHFCRPTCAAARLKVSAACNTF